MNRTNLITAIVFTIIGAVLGTTIARFLEERGEVDRFPVRQNSTEYTYINPLLECEAEDEARSKEVSFIEDEIQYKIKTIEGRSGVQSISVYFRDLNNGPWFGINEDTDFAPASLIKVPIFITLLKIAEREPALLEKRVTVPVEIQNTLTQNVAPKVSAQPGQEYSVRELMEIMMMYSDNIAMSLLQPFASDGDIQRTFAQVGVPFDVDVNGTDLRLTVRQYASFFRILYNASYLTRERSEYALGILARSDYVQALRAGVPNEVAVSHKFGERSGLGAYGPQQLHDCGVVYYPKSPYLLCVMTRGESVDTMQNVIRDVSRLFYEEVGLALEENR